MSSEHDERYLMAAQCLLQPNKQLAHEAAMPSVKGVARGLLACVYKAKPSVTLCFAQPVPSQNPHRLSLAARRRLICASYTDQAARGSCAGVLLCLSAEGVIRSIIACLSAVISLGGVASSGQEENQTPSKRV